jgi:aminoglycoside 6'-N-acetyltransferase
LAVYVDDNRIPWRGHQWSHLLADSAAELHAFAADLGLEPRQFHHQPARPWKDHYDLPEPKRREALSRGAQPITARETARMLRERRRAFAPTEPIRGERVALVPLRPEHAERLLEIRATESVARWWEPAPRGWPLHDEVDEEDTRLTVTVDGEVAGMVQFWEDPDPLTRHADVDIFLGPDHQDGGLGTDAMRAVIRHLTEDRGHHRVTLTASPQNERAVHVYEKLGFRRVGILRKAELSHITRRWEDGLLMELVV